MRPARDSAIAWSERAARREKLTRLKRAVVAGRYIVSPEAVARSILGRWSPLPPPAQKR